MDLLRRHTEEQEIYIIFPIKTTVVVHRTRIARNKRARQTSFLPRLECRNQCAKRCHRAGPEEKTRYMPVQKFSEPSSTTPVTERPTDNEHSVDLLLYAPEFGFTLKGTYQHFTAQTHYLWKC